jgi:oligoendopeptidase F
MDRFGAGVDYSGYEKARRYRWHAQLHIFEVPLYYIEYAIAQLGAFQVWSHSRKNQGRAVENYKMGLSLGGSRPLPELFTAAGIRFDFSDATMRPLMDELKSEISRYAAVEA